MLKMNNRCALPSTAPVLHARIEGTTNADTLHAIAPNAIAATRSARPRSGAATTVKHTPNRMTAHATIITPTSALADGLPTTPSFSNSARPAMAKGRSARPCRSPSPITAPMVAAAATAPTRTPVVIRESVIDAKGNGPGEVAQGDVTTLSNANRSRENAVAGKEAQGYPKDALLAQQLTVMFLPWQQLSVQHRLYSSSRTGAKCSRCSSAHCPTTGTRS